MAIPEHKSEQSRWRAHPLVEKASPTPPFATALERGMNNEAKLIALGLIALNVFHPSTPYLLAKQITQRQGKPEIANDQPWAISKDTIRQYFARSWGPGAAEIVLPGQEATQMHINPAVRVKVLFATYALLSFSQRHPDVSLAKLMEENALNRLLVMQMLVGSKPGEEPENAEISKVTGLAPSHVSAILKAFDRDGVLNRETVHRGEPISRFIIAKNAPANPPDEMLVPPHFSDRKHQIRALYETVHQAKNPLTYKELFRLFQAEHPKYKLSFTAFQSVLYSCIGHWTKKETPHHFVWDINRNALTLQQRSLLQDFITTIGAVAKLWENPSPNFTPEQITLLERQLQELLDSQSTVLPLMAKARDSSRSNATKLAANRKAQTEDIGQPIEQAIEPETISDTKVSAETPEPSRRSSFSSKRLPIAPTAIDTNMPREEGNEYIATMHRYPGGLSGEQAKMVFSYLEQGLSLRALFEQSNFLDTFPKDTKGQQKWQQAQAAYHDALADGEDLVGFFTRCNLRLVASVARRFVNKGLPYIDLLQEGNIGLIRAVEKFDHTRDLSFANLAIWWIAQAMDRAIDNTARTVRLPVWQETRLSQLHKTARILGLSHPFDDLDATIKKFNEGRDKPLTYDDAVDLLTAQQPMNSLDAPIGTEEDLVLYDSLPDPSTEDPAAIIERHHPGLMDDLADILTAREFFVIEASFGIYDPGRGLEAEEDHTNVWIGKQLKISNERVRQIAEGAFKKIRGNLQFMSNWRTVFA